MKTGKEPTQLDLCCTAIQLNISKVNYVPNAAYSPLRSMMCEATLSLTLCHSWHNERFAGLENYMNSRSPVAEKTTIHSTLIFQTNQTLYIAYTAYSLIMSLSGKIAIVTGASRGIGAGIALELAKQGAKVCISTLH